MDTVKIGGIDRKVEMRLHECQRILKEYNLFWTLNNTKIAQKHNALLMQIDRTVDTDEKVKLINEYTKKIQSDQALIRIPVALFYDAIWRVLSEDERKKLKSKKKMIRAILLEEHDALIYFVGNRILNLPGYKKKR